MTWATAAPSAPSWGRTREWGAFVPSMLPYLVHQESVFLSPTAFSPLK